MRTYEAPEKITDDLYAGGLQDIYALIIFGKEHKGTFIDIGCRHPRMHNNTYLLELYGWKGFGVDLEDFSKQWESERDSEFILASAFDVDYKKTFKRLNFDKVVDFLSIDLEISGDRFKCLNQIFDTGYEFKTITIEHDAYCGYDETEKIPQRNYLRDKGYILVREDDYIEDFWINPKYVNEDQYQILIQTNPRNSPEIQPAMHLKNMGYDWAHFYK